MQGTHELNWSFSTLGCPEMTLPEMVALAQAYAIRQLELRVIEDRIDLPPLLRARYGEPARLQAYLEGEGMRASLDTSLKLVGSTEADRAAFLEFIEWAEALGALNLRVFDGGKTLPLISDEDVAEAVKTITWWRGERAAHNWSSDIVVETHDCLTNSPSILKLQAALDEPVKILWDSHHTWHKGQEPIAETWAKIRPYVHHVHVKDSIDKPSARHDITCVMLGEGQFDLAGTLALLVADAYAGTVSIEWERKWHPYMPPLEEALKRARALGWW